jgi:hypothetical protein
MDIVTNLLEHFHVLIIGRSGSGKTIIAKYLMSVLDFNAVYIICGVPGTYHEFEQVFTIRDSFDGDHVKAWMNGHKEAGTPRILLLLDDITGQLLGQGKVKKDIEQVWTTMRVHNCSSIIITHKLTSIPVIIRDMWTRLIATKMDDDIYAEIKTDLPDVIRDIKDQYEIIKTLRPDKYEYLYATREGVALKFKLN